MWAAGKTLEEATGVMPVFVVNMGDGGMAGGLPINAKTATTAAAGAGAGALSLQSLRFTGALLGGATMSQLALMGAGAVATAIAGVAAAGAAGYGTGWVANKGIEYADDNFDTNIGNSIGRTVAVFLAPFSETARTALTQEFKAKAAELSGTLNIKIDQDGRATATMNTNQSGININMANGPHMLAL